MKIAAFYVMTACNLVDTTVSDEPAVSIYIAEESYLKRCPFEGHKSPFNYTTSIASLLA
jgi:hypothetical protein